jgi:hypothetical protein
MADPKNFNAIIIGSNVDFNDRTGKGPIDKVSPIVYHDNADNEMIVLNTNHKTFGFLKGKYIGTDPLNAHLKGRVYNFKISLDSSNTALISNNNYVSAPCPDFCSGGEKAFRSKKIRVNKLK